MCNRRLENLLIPQYSVFDGVNLLQTSFTATEAPNSCSYADIAVASIINTFLDQKATCFNDLAYFGRYREDCFSHWKRSMEKLISVYNFLISLNPSLQWTFAVQAFASLI